MSNQAVEDEMLADYSENEQRDRYDSVNFNLRTPEGVAEIQILEDKPGKIFRIIFTIGKAGSLTNAWAQALADSVSYSLRRGMDISQAIEMLSNITSSRPVYDAKGIACRSGPEALYMVLMKYQTMNKKNTKVLNNPDYRPPRLGKY